MGEPGLPRERIRVPDTGERWHHESRVMVDGDDFARHIVTPVHRHFAALAGSSVGRHLCFQGARGSGPINQNGRMHAAARHSFVRPFIFN